MAFRGVRMRRGMAGATSFPPAIRKKERKLEMKRSLFMGVLFAGMCLAMTSCVTCKQSDQRNVPFHCIVQSATDLVVIYEINFDGKLVSSGRTIPKEKGTQILEFTTPPGDHVLTVTAPGCETWQKTITVMGGIKYGQTFLVELKKSEK